MAQTRNFNNISGTPQLAAPLAATDTSLALTSVASSFPVVPFTIAVDQGLPGEEIILVGAVTGSTMSTLTRGFDGTAAQSHGAGAAVTHVVAAEAFNKAYRHLDGVDPAHGVGVVVGTTETQALTNKQVAGAFTGTATSAQTPTGSAGFAFTQDTAGRTGVRVVNTVGGAAANPVEVTNGTSTLFKVDGVGAVTAPTVTATTTTATTSHLGTADATSLSATTVTGTTVSGTTVAASGALSGASLTVSGSASVGNSLALPDRGAGAGERVTVFQGASDTGAPLVLRDATGVRFAVLPGGGVYIANSADPNAEHMRVDGNSLRQNGNKHQVLDIGSNRWAPPVPTAAVDLTQSGAVSITNNGAISWQTKSNDAESLYVWNASGLSATQVKVPFTGRYVVTVNVPCSVSTNDGTSLGFGNVQVLRNGTVIPQLTTAIRAGGFTSFFCSGDTVLNQGDILSVALGLQSPATATTLHDGTYDARLSVRFAGWN